VKVDRKIAEKSLSSKGFVCDKSGDHVVYYHEYNGKETGIKTYFSHSLAYKDIGPDNLKKMQSQLKLESVRDVRGLLECPMSKTQYERHLKESGVLNPDEGI
jgi:hypothetical protein